MTKTFQHIKDIDGWLTPDETKCLYDLVASLPHDSIVVEIGSYRGKSTVALGLGALSSGGHVFAIDPHEGAKYGFSMADEKHLIQNLKAFAVEKAITVITATSKDTLKTWEKQIDVLWIDGDHEYEAVSFDVRMWGSWVKRGGYIAMHDCGSDKWWGVQQAYNELLASGDFEHVYDVDSLRLARRISGQPLTPIIAESQDEKPAPKPKAKKAKATV